MTTEQKQGSSINTNFIKEWQPYSEMEKKVKNAIKSHFYTNVYQWQETHDPNSKQPFKPLTFSQIDSKLGLAYTSSSSYAALWVCNGGYLWADDTHHFRGFAINTEGEVIAIADDQDENEIYIKL